MSILGFGFGMLSISCRAVFASIPNELEPPSPLPRKSNPIESRLMKYNSRNDLLKELIQVRKTYERFSRDGDSIGMGTQSRFARIIHMRAKQLGFNLGSQSVNPSSSSDVASNLLQSWGWSRVDCKPGAVFISGIEQTPVCVNPNSSLRAGNFRYDSAEENLIRLSSNPSSSPLPVSSSQDSAENILSSWGWKRIKCQSNVVFVFGIEDDPVCVRPLPELRPGNFQYNPDLNQLVRIN